EIGERDDVPEVLTQLGKIGTDPAAIDGDRVASGRRGRYGLGYPGECRKDVADLLDIDQLVHGDHALLRERLAVLIGDRQLSAENLRIVEMGNGKLGRAHVEIAVVGIGAAQRKDRSNSVILGKSRSREGNEHREGKNRTLPRAQHRKLPIYE